jgi:hypothetical protein
VAALALLLASCTDNRLRLYPVKGTVRVNGQPAKDVQVIFFHTEGFDERTVVPTAWTQEDGSFVLTTFKSGDGAPAGDYEVKLLWPQYRRPRGGDGPDRLQGRFADPKRSQLRAHIEAQNDNELPPFEITGKVLPLASPKVCAKKHD